MKDTLVFHRTKVGNDNYYNGLGQMNVDAFEPPPDNMNGQSYKGIFQLLYRGISHPVFAFFLFFLLVFGLFNMVKMVNSDDIKYSAIHLRFTLPEYLID